MLKNGQIDYIPNNSLVIQKFLKKIYRNKFISNVISHKKYFKEYFGILLFIINKLLKSKIIINICWISPKNTYEDVNLL